MQIASHLPNILRLISTNPIVAIIAPTGSGKSIGIPAAIAAQKVRIFITVPTITAAKSLANFQKLSNPKVNVGFAAEGQIAYTEKDQIVYTTTGHMRKKMLDAFTGNSIQAMTWTDVLMVDEVHAGTLDNTIVLSLWLYAANRAISVPRLIIANATLSDTDKAIFPKITEYKIELNHHPVEIRYLPQDVEMDSIHILDETFHKTMEYHGSSITGDFLIFVSGAAEVDRLITSLSKSSIQNAQLIPVYGSMNQEDINKIYEKSNPNIRKIIVSTNVAESS